MPPLSFTHWKYAATDFEMSWKSVPGSNVTRPPILIGAPVAFLPVPRPQTLFVAVCFPDPTGACPPAPVAMTVTSAAARPPTARETTTLNFLELILPPCCLLGFDCLPQPCATGDIAASCSTAAATASSLETRPGNPSSRTGSV